MTARRPTSANSAPSRGRRTRSVPASARAASRNATSNPTVGVAVRSTSTIAPPRLNGGLDRSVAGVRVKSAELLRHDLRPELGEIEHGLQAVCCRPVPQPDSENEMATLLVGLAGSPSSIVAIANVPTSTMSVSPRRVSVRPQGRSTVRGNDAFVDRARLRRHPEIVSPSGRVASITIR